MDLMSMRFCSDSFWCQSPRWSAAAAVGINNQNGFLSFINYKKRWISCPRASAPTASGASRHAGLQPQQ
jgi:hypothetical protein